MRRRNSILLILILSVALPLGAQKPDGKNAKAQSSAVTPADRERARKLFAEAWKDAKDGYFRSAISLLRKGLQIDASDYKAHLLLAVTLERQGRILEAIPEYRAVLALAPAGSAEAAHAQRTAGPDALEKLLDACKAEFTPAIKRHKETGVPVFAVRGRNDEVVSRLAAYLDLPPASSESELTPPGCIGWNEGLDGTERGANCLQALLGEPYEVRSQCSDGTPFSVHVLN